MNHYFQGMDSVISIFSGPARIEGVNQWGGSQWGGGFYGYRLKFWLFYGYRLIFFQFRLTKRLNINFFCFKKLLILINL